MLDLSQNKIGEIGAQHLSQILQNNKVTNNLYSDSPHTEVYLFAQTLKTLNLSGNQIGHMGTKYLSDALQINKVCFSSRFIFPNENVFV
jgi:Ran GTPase-activating protein (RanGAP) involved in mRNA processing and transport